MTGSIAPIDSTAFNNSAAAMRDRSAITGLGGLVIRANAAGFVEEEADPRGDRDQHAKSKDRIVHAVKPRSSGLTRSAGR